LRRRATQAQTHALRTCHSVVSGIACPSVLWLSVLAHGGARVRGRSFDILSDEEVRQGLKEYSKWPTYPQVYAKGQLVGGLDIIKELIEGDELKEALGVQ